MLPLHTLIVRSDIKTYHRQQFVVKRLCLVVDKAPNAIMIKADVNSTVYQ